MAIRLEAIYAPSDDVVAREIEEELIIVPLAAGIGDMEDELYTVNGTAKAIWNQLDGKKSLSQVTTALADVYEALPEEIERDVFGFVEELLKRRMLIEVATV